MKKSLFLLPVMAVFALVSCGSYERAIEDFAYIHDAERDMPTEIRGEYSKGIQVNDLLNIYVESEEPSSTIQFNQETNKIAVSASGTPLNGNSYNNTVPGYLVNAEGEITFPVLGKIKVLGKSHNELARIIEDRLRNEGHIKDPRVTVKLMNFKVCVLGEVAKPGELLVDGERITVLEAISQCGDLTIYGLRTNVTVIREENGIRTVGQLDLTSKDIFTSPFYYLHQNDVVYIEPNNRRKRQGTRDPNMFSYISTGISVLSLAVTSIYYITLAKSYSNR